MFGLLKKPKVRQKLNVMGHEVDVLSIIRDGKVIFTGNTAEAYPRDHLEGKIFEVAFSTTSGNPYFVYYVCYDYYLAVASYGASSFGGSAKAEQFRSTVSQALAGFLVNHLKQTFKIDTRADILSFSHNRAHTNVLTYVSSLESWYPIQHNDAEGDDASERKAARVNAGALDISEVVAVKELSPT